MSESIFLTGNGQGATILQNQTRYSGFGMGPLDFQTTQIDRQIIHRAEGFYNVLAVRCSAHFRGAGVITAQQAGADTALTLSIAASTAGYFEFTLTPDPLEIVYGDLLNYKTTCAASVGGTMTLTGIQVTFTPSDSTKTVVRYFAVITNNYYAIGSNFLSLTCLQGSQFNVESRAQFGMSSDAVMKHLDYYLPVNSRGGVDAYSRIDGARGNLASDMGTVGTGYFNDLVNQDDLTYGNLICLELVGGAVGGGSNTISPKWVAVDMETTDGTFYVIYGQPASLSAATSPDYFPIAGSSPSGQGTESGAQFDLNLARRAADLWTQVEVGSPGTIDSRIMLRKNGVDTQLYTDIDAFLEGPFRSRFSELFAAGDDIDIQWDGNVILFCWGFRLHDDVARTKLKGLQSLLGNMTMGAL